VLRAILPPRVAGHIDWDTLEAEHASVVDDLFKQRHGDLVFSAQFRHGGQGFLWLLFEHQSSVDRWMILLRQLERREPAVVPGSGHPPPCGVLKHGRAGPIRPTRPCVICIYCH
jgi:hypothetical protein